MSTELGAGHQPALVRSEVVLAVLTAARGSRDELRVRASPVRHTVGAVLVIWRMNSKVMQAKVFSGAPTGRLPCVPCHPRIVWCAEV